MINVMDKCGIVKNVLINRERKLNQNHENQFNMMAKNL